MNIAKNLPPVKSLTPDNPPSLPQIDAVFGFSHDDLMEYEGFDGRYGLPDRMRREALAHGEARRLRIYEAWWMTGLHELGWVTLSIAMLQLASIGLLLSKDTCRRACNSPFFECRTRPADEPANRGARPKEYRVRPMTDVCRALGLDPHTIDLYSTIFSVAHLRSTRAYKTQVCVGTACHYGEAAYGWLASIMGQSRRTIIRWLKTSPDVEITRQYQRQDLSIYDNALSLVAQFEAKNRESGRQRHYVEAVTWHEEAPHERVKAYPCIVAAVRRAEKAGARLVLVTCLTNHYRPREGVDEPSLLRGGFLPY